MIESELLNLHLQTTVLLLQRDEPRGVGGTDTWSSVLDWFAVRSSVYQSSSLNRSVEQTY
jgi:hypothetical protein